MVYSIFRNTQIQILMAVNPHDIPISYPIDMVLNLNFR